MDQPELRPRRLIRSWTRTHDARKCVGNCEQCDQPITWGVYRREVYVDPHPRYGDEFVIVRTHEEPGCLIYDDPHWQR